MAKHTCTVCGTVGEWSNKWSWNGSINHMDACPDDLPKACCDQCAKVMGEKIESGEWVLPMLGKGGRGGPNVVAPRKGY